VESGEGIERVVAGNKFKWCSVWNPVKELKGIYIKHFLPPLEGGWNPVKELKEICRFVISAILLTRWNPVKELKDL